MNPLRLECTGVTLTIGGKAICRELQLTIAAGETWAVLGPNGAGKTTLLTALAGLRDCDGGTIRLDGISLSDWPRRSLAQRRGFMPQHAQDEFGGSLLDTALAGRHPHLGRWAWETANDQRIAGAALAAVELDAAHFDPLRDVRTLSGGERQRLALAALLAQDPQLLLLDEPTSHLDLRHQLRTLDLLSRLRSEQNKTIVVALHDVNLAARFCDRVLLLRDGETRAGTRQEMLTVEQLEWLYRHPMLAVPVAGTQRTLFAPR
jgi:iron complex transport system ATP-binding protein